ncbi:hypothetical protein R6Q59_033642 [Mikania micrantha]
MSMKEDYEFHEATYMDENGELKTTKVPVVQEVARRGIFPQRFIASVAELAGAMETPPVIDIAKLQSDCSRTQELQRLAQAAKDWGLFLIKNHGVVLEDAKDVVKSFFALTFEEKKLTVGSYNNVDNMGYGKNFVKSQHQPLDWIDRLTMIAAPPVTSGLSVWPHKPPNFRKAIENYVEQSRKVLDGLLQDLAESLSLDQNAFLQYFEPQQSEIKVRVNYYPPCPRPDLAIGLMPHTDASGLTLLLEFGATGALQVRKGSTAWATLKWPKDNSLLVSIGDLLEIMTNGVLKSTWHQVRTKLHVDRFSLAYFYNPPPHTLIGPVVGCGPMEEIMYKKVVVEDYVSNYYKISPTTSKEAIMYAKIIK